MIEQVGQLICSQENQPGTNKSTRKIAEQLNIYRSSVQRIVRRIVRRDLQLSAFRRVPAQIISESVKQKRHERCKKLIRHIPVKFAKKVFLLMKKTFTRMFLLTIEMTCLVRWQEARRRQKAPNSEESEICQRHGLCWCVLWQKRKTAFHSRQGKSKW